MKSKEQKEVLKIVESLCRTLGVKKVDITMILNDEVPESKLKKLISKSLEKYMKNE